MFHMLTTTEYAPVTDQDTLRRLLTRIAAGEREALAELYHCTRAAVYGLALSYLRNAQDAQDLTQDVYVQVWDHAEQYRPTGSPLDPDRVPEPLPDTIAAGGAPRRAQRRGMGRHSRRRPGTGCR